MAFVVPLFLRIDARVGTVFSSAARNAVIIKSGHKPIEVGSESIAWFTQVFEDMFTRTVELPDSPPWREGVTGMDGVIVLERIDTNLKLGGDEGELVALGLKEGNPDVVSIAYRVCMYETSGAEISCWDTSSQQIHQRGMLECLNTWACIVPQTDIAMREAIARFMVEADNDPALRALAERVAQKGGTQ